MKIAIVSFLWGDLGGGAAMVARRVAHGMKAQGLDVVVITTQRESGVRVRWEEGVKVISFFPANLYWVADKNEQPVVKKVFWQLWDLWNPHAYRVLRQIFSRERPFLVHVHKLRGLSPSVWAAARRSGVEQIIHTAHDFELVSPQGTLSGRVGRWAKEGAWWIRPYQKIRARFSRVVTAATAPSRFLLQPLLARGFFPKGRQGIVPNSHGISLERLEQEQEKLSVSASDETRVLYLGRLEKEKGIKLLCKAFKQVSSAHSQLHLDIAGWGPLETYVRTECDAWPQMQFHGAVYGLEKERLLSQSDVLALPTMLPESFGNVVVEAFAHGAPVIASRIGAVPELISEKNTGWLLPPGDIAAWVMILQRLAQKPGVIRQLSGACYTTARQYTPQRVIDQYLDVYQLPTLPH